MQQRSARFCGDDEHVRQEQLRYNSCGEEAKLPNKLKNLPNQNSRHTQLKGVFYLLL
jgi:hypothetical protein